MSARAPFSWLDSNGWIVLSGPPDALSEIRAQALSRYDGAGAIAYISLAPDLGDALMDDMAELGAPTGYLVDLEASDNNEIYERLAAAGMIVIEAERDSPELGRLLTQTVASALKTALERGALILFEGAAAALASDGRFSVAGGGLNVVQNALITARHEGEAERDFARVDRRDLQGAAVMGLARGSALALGPGRQIETWGRRRRHHQPGRSAGAGSSVNSRGAPLGRPPKRQSREPCQSRF